MLFPNPLNKTYSNLDYAFDQQCMGAMIDAERYVGKQIACCTTTVAINLYGDYLRALRVRMRTTMQRMDSFERAYISRLN